MGERKYTLTEELLVAYQSAALDNAHDLLVESRILLDRDRYARAYFLAVSAMEEIGKAYLAFSSRSRNLRNEALQKRLKDIFENHSQKITAAFQARLQHMPLQKLHSEFDQMIEYTIHLEKGRESSMYVDAHEDGSLSVPSELTRPVAARDCLALATECFEHMREFLSTATLIQWSEADDKLLLISPKKQSQMWQSPDFGRYIFDELAKNPSKFNVSRAIVLYFEQYFSQGKLYKNI